MTDDSFDLYKDLCIDRDNLNEELMDQPLLMRKVCEDKARASENLRIIEQKLDEARSMSFLHHQKEGGTVKTVECKVKVDPVIIKLQEEVIEAKYIFESIEGLVKAVSQRHDMLKELMANKRRELEDL